MEAAHKNAPVDKNIEILFKNISIGDRPFLPLFYDCIARSGTPIHSWKIFRRALRALNLAQYVDHTLDVEGGWVECGVFSGFSALMTAEIHRIRNPEYRGEGLHLIDSFEGLSQPTINDATGKRDLGNGETERISNFRQGHFAAGLDQVQLTMHPFPHAQYHKGWVPDILEALPDQKWAFVHIDVDLYEPTLGCLEYFVPRMACGGCIVNDDFSSPLFPGGGIAWREYCERHGLSYAILDSGQSVLFVE